MPPFAQALQSLQKTGDLSPIVETQFGYHIIRLEEFRPEGRRSFDEVREQLLLNARSTLVREARTREVQRFQEGSQPNQAAIESYSSQFTPVEGAR